MKNQIIDSFIINPHALNSEKDKQSLYEEVSNLYADMAVVSSLANDNEAHGPVSDEIKAEIAADIKRDLSSLLAEADSLKAVFVIAYRDDNQYRTIHAGELPALSRVVLLTGVESMNLAQSLAKDIRNITDEDDEEQESGDAAETL
jgi:hypothetical protein